MASPGTPVGIADLFNQRGQMVMLIARAATQRVGFLGQARVLVVFECQLVAVGQRQADDVAEVIQRNRVLFTAEVAASGHPVIGVVVNQRLATQHVYDAGGCPSMVPQRQSQLSASALLWLTITPSAQLNRLM